jgi:hypothetical protein
MELTPRNINSAMIFKIAIGFCLLAMIFLSPCYTFVDLPLYAYKAIPKVEQTTILSEALSVGKKHLLLNWCGVISNIGACMILLLCAFDVIKIKIRFLILVAILLVSGFTILFAQLHLPTWVYSRWQITVHLAYPMFIAVNILFGLLWLACMQKSRRT